MWRKFLALFLFCILLFGMGSVSAGAETIPYFTFSLDTESAVPDDLVKLQINANKMSDTAAGFRMRIDYDESDLSFVRTETSSQIKSGTMMTSDEGNPIYSVYICNVDQKTAPVLSGNIISFVFKVNKDAEDDETAISARIDEVCNYQAEDLDVICDEDLTLNLVSTQEVSDKAYLTELEPFTGVLNPEFSSDTFEYSMTVASEVKSVEFSAAAGAGGTVKINRKTLGKAGSDTVIIAAATSADKKNHAQYLVTVHRADLPISSGGESSAKPSGTTSRSGGAKGGLENVNAPKDDKFDYAPEKDQNGQNYDGANSPYEGGIASHNGQITADARNPLQQQAVGTGDRIIYIMGNQMPNYVIFFFICSQFILIGILVMIWMGKKTKK